MEKVALAQKRAAQKMAGGLSGAAAAVALGGIVFEAVMISCEVAMARSLGE